MTNVDDKLKTYLQHRSSAVDYATSITGCREVAEDLVQEAYFRFVLTSESPNQPVAYLYRTVRNLALDLTRRVSIETRHTQEDSIPWVVPMAISQPERTLQNQDELHHILQLLDRLPETSRRAVELYRIEGLTLEQVAEELDLSISSIHRLVRDAMVKVTQEMLENDES